MFLSGPRIRELVRTDAARRASDELPRIRIEPFDDQMVGPNSYDVHLAPTLLVYWRPRRAWWERVRDAARALLDLPPSVSAWHLTAAPHLFPYTARVHIPPEGLVLQPGTLYLGATVERTVTEGLVPWLDGRSSVGRLGIRIHATAGRGDDGFGAAVDGGSAWTLEIDVVHPVRVFAGMKIAQITYAELAGPRQPYAGRYADQRADPVPSRFGRGE